ncbi:hypothetical protein [Mycoplasmopsis cynos]|uniref:hypothetical protein n=1 Tax=Mycoplasmopsis cynos TaxID=171284 RepID=UPI00220B4EE9|nr:hypothetical protein [Mycoplasmopsis cynos]UWV83245.1 hypothetical protein NW067_03375 [Mycoplasmopsis cynos]
MQKGIIPYSNKSKNPPENACGIWTPKMFASINDIAHIAAWNPQNIYGAKNKKVNSIGSVTPVTAVL